MISWELPSLLLNLSGVDSLTPIYPPQFLPYQEEMSKVLVALGISEKDCILVWMIVMSGKNPLPEICGSVKISLELRVGVGIVLFQLLVVAVLEPRWNLF